MRPRLGSAYHLERSTASRLGLSEYPCACNRCRGGRHRKVEIVARHHRIYGRDPYLKWLVIVSPLDLHEFALVDGIVRFQKFMSWWEKQIRLTLFDTRQF